MRPRRRPGPPSPTRKVSATRAGPRAGRAGGGGGGGRARAGPGLRRRGHLPGAPRLGRPLARGPLANGRPPSRPRDREEEAPRSRREAGPAAATAPRPEPAALPGARRQATAGDGGGERGSPRGRPWGPRVTPEGSRPGPRPSHPSRPRVRDVRGVVGEASVPAGGARRPRAPPGVLTGCRSAKPPKGAVPEARPDPPECGPLGLGVGGASLRAGPVGIPAGIAPG